MTPPDWSRQLPEPIDVGNGKQLTTLRDVEVYLLRLSPAQRRLLSWRLVEKALADALNGRDRRELVYAFKLAKILDP
jgi:hypothetical protein